MAPHQLASSASVSAALGRTISQACKRVCPCHRYWCKRYSHISACVQGPGFESYMCIDLGLHLYVQKQAYQTFFLSYLQFHQNVIRWMHCCQIMRTAYYVEVCPVVPQFWCSKWPDWGSQCKMQLSLPITCSHMFM